MTEAEEYLTVLEQKMRRKLEDEESHLQFGKEEIHRMNDFFWDNYTEMDEYGYEDYDNQQALLRQADANREKKLEIRKLIRMQDSPFFGGLYFRYEDEDEPEMFYIGIGNFSETAGDPPLVFDWRAPVSSMFYDFDQGPASYQAPGGVFEGELLRKHQYKIRGGRMIYEFENDTKIDDDILQEELGRRGTEKMRSIIRTIQKEQNVIIRSTKDRIMIIQGAAGSGKTSVALHRIAWLLYHERERLKSSQVLILSPNGIFSDYISQILPELGEENIREMSFDIFAWRQLRDTAADCEDRCQQMERMICAEKADRRQAQADRARYRYKQSAEFVRDMEGFLISLEDRLVDFRDVTFRLDPGEEKKYPQASMTMSAETIRDMFYGPMGELPILSRLTQAAERFIDEFETLYLSGKWPDLSPEHRQQITEMFRSMYEAEDIYEIYNMFLTDQGLPVLPQVPREERVLPYEDVYPVLWLKNRLIRRKPSREIRHLIIDEMQDYSYLQYVILRELFPCRMTILGDRAQALEPGQTDVLTFLPKVLGKDCRILQMNRSYRNTAEIAAYADSVFHVDGIEFYPRPGKPVEHVRGLSEEQTVRDLKHRLREDPGENQNIAVLTMTEKEARDLWEELKGEEYPREIHLLHRESTHFMKGITITTWVLAKGLEFDCVYIMPAGENSSFLQQFRYICATRAVHELVVYEPEEPPVREKAESE